MGSTDPRAIATLTSADIPQAMELSSEAGWNQLAEDWVLFFSLGEAFGIFEV